MTWWRVVTWAFLFFRIDSVPLGLIASKRTFISDSCWYPDYISATGGLGLKYGCHKAWQIIMRPTQYIVLHHRLSISRQMGLTHWGRTMHICVGKLTTIGSDNGLSPVRRQAIIWTNAGILSNGTLGTNFSEILIEILTFSFKKMRLKVSSAKWRPFCLGLNVLKLCWISFVLLIL